MDAFNPMPLIHFLRNQTLQTIQGLSGVLTELPEFREVITTGDRLYETNLRLILRHLKHVNRAYKRHGANEASLHITAYRVILKQFHDVDEAATQTILSLAIPCLDILPKDITPEKLKDILNAPITNSERASDDDIPAGSMESSPNTATTTSEVNDSSEWAQTNALSLSPSLKSDHSSPMSPATPGSVFNFAGSDEDNSTQTSDSRRSFHFRSASETSLTMSKARDNEKPHQEIHLPGQGFRGFNTLQQDKRQVLLPSRHVSAPVSSTLPQENSFLMLTGETLEQFIACMEVAESKLENKKHWLLLLQDPENAAFLGRWPTVRTLKKFMHMQNLEWVVRASGKWNLNLKTFREREILKLEALRKLFPVESSQIPQSPVESVSTETEIDGSEIANEPLENAITYEPESPFADPEEETFQEDNDAEETIVPVSAFADENGNLDHVFVFQKVDKTDDCLEKIEEPAETVEALKMSAYEDPNGILDHVFVWQKVEELTKGSSESAAVSQAVIIPQPLEAEEINATTAECGENDVASEDVEASQTVHENLSHVFVWLNVDGAAETAIDAAEVADTVEATEAAENGFEETALDIKEDAVDIEETPVEFEESPYDLQATPIQHEDVECAAENFEAPQTEHENLSHVFVWLNVDGASEVAINAIETIETVDSVEAAALTGSDVDDTSVEAEEIRIDVEETKEAVEESDFGVAENPIRYGGWYIDSDDDAAPKAKHENSNHPFDSLTAQTAVNGGDFDGWFEGDDLAVPSDSADSKKDAQVASPAVNTDATPEKKTKAEKKKVAFVEGTKTESDKKSALARRKSSSKINQTKTQLVTQVEPSPVSVASEPTSTTAPAPTPIDTPQNWSMLPIIAGVVTSALYVSARCPILPVLALTLWKMSMVNKSLEWKDGKWYNKK